MMMRVNRSQSCRQIRIIPLPVSLRAIKKFNKMINKRLKSNPKELNRKMNKITLIALKRKMVGREAGNLSSEEFRD